MGIYRLQSTENMECTFFNQALYLSFRITFPSQELDNKFVELKYTWLDL